MEHDTAVSSVPSELGGVGLATVDHVVPFQRTTNAPLVDTPVAKQVASSGHDTASRPGGLLKPPMIWRGAALAAQLRKPRPTPRAPAAFVATPGSGLAMIDQLEPSQCSSNTPSSADASKSPAAKQLVALGHDTPRSSASIAPPGSGTGMIDQLEPSQCSTSGSLTHSSSGGDILTSARVVSRASPFACRASILLPPLPTPAAATARAIGTPFHDRTSTPRLKVPWSNPGMMLDTKYLRFLATKQDSTRKGRAVSRFRTAWAAGSRYERHEAKRICRSSPRGNRDRWQWWKAGAEAASSVARGRRRTWRASWEDARRSPRRTRIAWSTSKARSSGSTAFFRPWREMRAAEAPSRKWTEQV